MSKKLVVACLLLGLAHTSCVLAADREAPSSEPFFAATLDDVQHRPMALAQLRGKPVLVNFWATWCVPCRAELPALADAYARGKAKGLALVSVALDDDAAAVGAFVAAHDMDYRVFVGKDQGLALMREFGNDRTAVPFTVAIDPAGNVVARKFGILRRGDLDRMLAFLAGQEGHDGVALRR